MKKAIVLLAAIAASFVSLSAQTPTPTPEAIIENNDTDSPFTRAQTDFGLLDYGGTDSTNPSTLANDPFNGAVGNQPRAYLRDIRQLLCWIVGLMLVMLTRDAWRGGVTGSH